MDKALPRLVLITILAGLAGYLPTEANGRMVRENVQFIDRTGKVALEAKFDDAWPFTEGLSLIRVGGQYGFIDRQGKPVVPPRYDEAMIFFEGLAAVKRGGLWGYIDRSGREVISPQFNLAGPFGEGLAGFPANIAASLLIEAVGRYLPCLPSWPISTGLRKDWSW